MSRKQGSVPEETRARLIESAVAEFGEYGFEKASTRRICANAGVTTGALYFFFDGKEDLFLEVVRPVMDGLLKIIDEHFAAELNSDSPDVISSNAEAEDLHAGELIIEAYYAHKDRFDIILSNREHPAVMAFFDSIMEMFDNQTVRLTKGSFLSDRAKSNFNEFTIHWFSHLQVEAVLHIISHGYDKETAKKQLGIMIKFLRGGFFALVSE